MTTTYPWLLDQRGCRDQHGCSRPLGKLSSANVGVSWDTPLVSAP